MKRSKQLATQLTPSEPDLPDWLKRLSKLLASMDTEYPWRIYERWREQGTSSRDRRSRKSVVVYCEDPRIAVTIGRGVWSLECVFEPRKSKSAAREEQK